MADLDQVLAQLRQEYEPGPDAAGRVRSAVADAVRGDGGGDGEAGGSGDPPVAPLGTRSSVPVRGGGWLRFWPAAAGIGVVGALAVSVAVGTSGGSPPPERTPKLAPIAPPVVDAPAIAEEPPPVAPVDAPEEPAPPTRSAPVARPASTGAPSEAPVTDLAEVRLLAQAAQAWREGRLADASAALAEHRRQFPRTAFGQERQGLSLALACAGGKAPEVRAAAERFLEKSPEAPMAAAIRKGCLP